jgi:hypothetical protein
MRPTVALANPSSSVQYSSRSSLYSSIFKRSKVYSGSRSWEGLSAEELNDSSKVIPTGFPWIRWDETSLNIG